MDGFTSKHICKKDIAKILKKMKNDTFKPLIISTSDGGGGAARAAMRLHQAFLKKQIKSKMMVQSKITNYDSVIGPKKSNDRITSLLRPYIDNAILRIYKNRKKTTWSVSFFHANIIKQIRTLEPNIIHLHWINGGFVSIENVSKLSVSVVWTLHDMWALTGGCHYTYNCERYKDKCGYCPQLGSKHEYDISRWQWKRKRKNWDKLDFTIIASSNWMKECVKKSTLLKNKKVTVIPNPIDTELFRPIDKKISRTVLGLPLDKKLILFSAFSASTDKRKGGQYLEKALRKIIYDYKLKDIDLVVLGTNAPPENIETFPNTHYFGYFNDDISQILLYSAVDLTVAPSIQENLSMTVMESLSCGTSCVAFKIGGMPDMIKHMENGYLVRPFDEDELAKGIALLIENDNLRDSLSKNARLKAVDSFSMEVISKKILKIYKSLL